MSRLFRQHRIRTDDGETPKFSKFEGIVNTQSYKDIGMGALVQGTNVLVSDSKKVFRAPGYQLALAGNIQGVYGRDDRMYVVNDGELLYMPYGDVGAAVSVTSGLAGRSYVWQEVNGDVHYVNGVDAGIARGPLHLPWRVAAPSIASVEVVEVGTRDATYLNLGATYQTALWRIIATYVTADGRESAPSEMISIRASIHTALLRITVPPQYAATNIYCTGADGDSTDFRKLITTTYATVTVPPAQRGERWLGRFTMPMPVGIEDIAFFGGSMYGSMYMPVEDQTVIWCSEPFAFHLWRTVDKGLLIKGRVCLLLAVKDGLIIGTPFEIRFFDGEKFPQLVDYGAVPGSAGDVTAEGVGYFWTTRGLCKAMPFSNLTEEKVSMPPGSVAYSKLLYLDGMVQFVTVTDGSGVAYNQRTERK